MYPPVSKSEAVYGSVTEIWFWFFAKGFRRCSKVGTPQVEASPSSSDLARGLSPGRDGRAASGAHGGPGVVQGLGDQDPGPYRRCTREGDAGEDRLAGPAHHAEARVEGGRALRDEARAARQGGRQPQHGPARPPQAPQEQQGRLVRLRARRPRHAPRARAQRHRPAQRQILQAPRRDHRRVRDAHGQRNRRQRRGVRRERHETGAQGRVGRDRDAKSNEGCRGRRGEARGVPERHGTSRRAEAGRRSQAAGGPEGGGGRRGGAQATRGAVREGARAHERRRGHRRRRRRR